MSGEHTHAEHEAVVEAIEAETEAAEAEAEIVETTAEAAVALATATAAAAEIDAAERVRDYAMELDECRSEIQRLSDLLTLSASADSERERILAERMTGLESNFGERMEKLESHPALTHHSSDNPGNPGTPELAGVSGEASLGSETGAEATASLGPVEAGAGGAIHLGEEGQTSESAPARRRRRWI